MGQLIRLILIFLAIWLVIHFVRRAIARHRDDTAGAARPAPARMLACTRCGTHVPESDAVIRDGKPYCCEDHVRAASNDRD